MIKKLITMSMFATAMFANTVLFDTDFSNAPLGLNALAIPDWTVTNFIDVVYHGQDGLINCYSGDRCIDLDGTSSTAGGISRTFITQPNTPYLFTVWLSGSQRDFPGVNPNTTQISITSSTGGVVSDITLQWNDPWQAWAMPWNSNGGGITTVSIRSLTLSNSDWVGNLLGRTTFIDTTNSTHMPEPGTWAMFGIGLVLVFIGKR